MTFELIRIEISYFNPGHKTSRNWSKPRKWCAFLFNLKIVYTARWRLFATPDTPWKGQKTKVPKNKIVVEANS